MTLPTFFSDLCSKKTSHLPAPDRPLAAFLKNPMVSGGTQASRSVIRKAVRRPKEEEFEGVGASARNLRRAWGRTATVRVCGEPEPTQKWLGSSRGLCVCDRWHCALKHPYQCASKCIDSAARLQLNPQIHSMYWSIRSIAKPPATKYPSHMCRM